jgi:hypothetical protein
MEIGASLPQIERHQNPKLHYEWEQGLIYQIAVCPACSNVTLRRCMWHEDMEADECTFTVLYPSSRSLPPGMPEKIAQAYEAASRVKDVDANAYAVLLGRVLELICIDRGAKGKFVAEKLKHLAEKNEIPENLVKVAAGLRNLRNVGAHAELGELTPAEIPILTKLCVAIVEYVYSAPHLATQAEECLNRLKGKGPQKADPGTSGDTP